MSRKAGRPKDTTPKVKFHPSLILPEDHPLVPFLRQAKEDGQLAARIIEGLMLGGVETADMEEDIEIDASGLLI